AGPPRRGTRSGSGAGASVHLLFLAGRTLLYRRASFALLLLVTAGAVGLQIANSANLEGYSREIFRRGAEDIFGHAVVSSTDGEPFAAAVVARLDGADGVAVAAPRFSQPGVMFAKGRRHPVNAVGLVPEREERANHFCARIKSGRCPRPGAGE